MEVEVRRVATERLTHAADQLSHRMGEDPAEAIHAARKDLKKTRSLLRLARETLGDETYRIENDRLREAAHLLAGAREQDAKLEAVTSLVENHGNELGAEAATALRAWQGALRGESLARSNSFATEGATALVCDSRDASRMWTIDARGFGVVAPGLERAYRRGRRGLARARGASDDETLHEWRKRVKDLWYALRLLSAAWPPVVEAMAGEAHALSELLGDHHDLGELRRDLELGGFGIPAHSQGELLALVESRQTALHLRALEIGTRLYAEKPSRLMKRLGRLWAAAQPSQEGLPSA
jgi:CHAD domain-containing protein